MKKLIICFMGLLAITACEFNDKVDNFSIGGLDTLNLDSVVVVDEIAQMMIIMIRPFKNGLVLVLISLMVLIFPLLNKLK